MRSNHIFLPVATLIASIAAGPIVDIARPQELSVLRALATAGERQALQIESMQHRIDQLQTKLENLQYDFSYGAGPAPAPLPAKSNSAAAAKSTAATILVDDSMLGPTLKKEYIPVEYDAKGELTTTVKGRVVATPFAFDDNLLNRARGDTNTTSRPEDLVVVQDSLLGPVLTSYAAVKKNAKGQLTTTAGSMEAITPFAFDSIVLDPSVAGLDEDFETMQEYYDSDQ